MGLSGWWYTLKMKRRRCNIEQLYQAHLNNGMKRVHWDALWHIGVGGFLDADGRALARHIAEEMDVELYGY